MMLFLSQCSGIKAASGERMAEADGLRFMEKAS